VLIINSLYTFNKIKIIKINKEEEEEEKNKEE
jgi:hypothetical protein